MKKNMTKLLSLLLVLMMIASVTIGCSETGTVDPKDDVTETNNDGEGKGSEEESKSDFSNLSENQINGENIMTIVEELSSEKYRGRLPGTVGNRLSVEYIVSYFKKIGLEKAEGLDDYEQRFEQGVRITNSAPTLGVVDKEGNVVVEYEYLKDFSPSIYPPKAMIKGEVEGEVYEVKNISDISSDNEDIKGKVVLIDIGQVRQVGYAKFFNMVSSDELGLKAVIMGAPANPKAQQTEYSFRVAPHPRRDTGAEVEETFILATCNAEAYTDILDKAGEGNLVKLSIDYENAKTESSNVIGVIPGTDEELKDEYIIIGGHMDHVGDNKNGTYNAGALDNASGTATMMEIARIMMENEIKPKKTIVFMGFNGEEEGLIGSRYYADYPIYPLDKTTVINLDMVGSKRAIPLQLTNATREETDLRETLYRYGKDLGIEVKKGSTGASDHVPFAHKGVPAILLIHMDLESGYHTPDDTIETVDKSRIEAVTKLVLYYLDKKAY